MAIRNTRQNIIIAERTQIAATFWRRLKGLLGTRVLPDGEALIITPCSSVHTFGMKYAIDVVFAGKDGCILKTVHMMEPGRMAACAGSSYVVELPAGTLDRTGTHKGDIIEFR